MKVFISWSGSRSQALAEALRDWLPLILQYVKPWVSKSDIQSGERWGVQVANELQESNFGIICVTKDNLTAPWILFEAGAIAKSMQDGRVIPLLLDLDVKDISGPLAQFQAKKAEKEGIRELVFDLNRLAQAGQPEDLLSQTFDPLYSLLEAKLTAIPGSGSQKQTRPQGEILEELVSGVRNMEMRFRDAVDEEPGFRRKYRNRRMHPEMLMHMTRDMSDGPDDPVQILVYFSLFKDDMPWLYELATELYRAIGSKDRLRSRSAHSRLMRAMDMARRGPMMDMIGDKTLYMMISEAREFIPVLSGKFLENAEAATDVQPPRRVRMTSKITKG